MLLKGAINVIGHTDTPLVLCKLAMSDNSGQTLLSTAHSRGCASSEQLL